MRKYITEFIGTLFLVFTVCCTALTGAPLGALAVGSVLMVMIFAGGHISGGHYNPAVSLAVFLRGRNVTGRDLGAAFVAELLFTFALAYVVVNVATSKDHPDNSFYGLAIGFTIFVGAVSVGKISGAVFNPAVGFGTSLSGITDWSMIWVYILAPLVGGAIAAFTFRALNPDDLVPSAGSAAGEAAGAGATRVPTRRRP
jgi:aquaporin Z